MGGTCMLRDGSEAYESDFPTQSDVLTSDKPLPWERSLKKQRHSVSDAFDGVLNGSEDCNTRIANALGLQSTLHSRGRPTRQ